MRPSIPARHRSVRPVLVAAVLVGGLSLAVTALSGCGGVGYADTAPGAAPASPTAPDRAPAAGSGSDAPADADPALAAGEVDGVGQVVVDAAGFTLYRFDSDTADPPTSACSGDCAEVWPPLTVEDASAPAANGIDAGLLGTLTRDDGSVQVTLAGWPLYRYAEDGAPGDALGHGVGGTWFAVTPTGGRAAAGPDEDPSTAGSDGYGYDY
jgi:predicted lipoprotein with Yx(FWY)xxD motif